MLKRIVGEATVSLDYLSCMRRECIFSLGTSTLRQLLAYGLLGFPMRSELATIPLCLVFRRAEGLRLRQQVSKKTSDHGCIELYVSVGGWRQYCM